jgi:hypothetical protein
MRLHICTGCRNEAVEGGWLRGEDGDRWYCETCEALLESTRAPVVKMRPMATADGSQAWAKDETPRKKEG